MLSALGFLTIIGPARAPERSALAWFPLVGAAVGGVLALVWWAAEQAFDPLLAAAIVVAVDLLLTGLLHVDGLADSADGLVPHMDRDRRLEVMRRPDIGAFAIAVVPAVLLLRWAALGTQPVEPLLLVGLWALSRAFVAAVPAFVPYARADGLVTGFLGGASPWLVLGAVPAVGVLFAGLEWVGLVAAAAGLLAGVGVVALARRRLGGFTGDVLGAAVVLVETTGLILAAADW